MELLPLIIQLLSGAAGGNIAGKPLKDFNLGTVGNSVAGILGGGLGGQVLAALGAGGAAALAGSGSLDIASIISSVASGGVGGGALIAIIGMIKKLLGTTASS